MLEFIWAFHAHRKYSPKPLELADLPGQLNMTIDILVCGKTTQEHEENLIAVLKRLEEIGLTLNREKCEFYKKELTFYGLHFSAKGISNRGSL